MASLDWNKTLIAHLLVQFIFSICIIVAERGSIGNFGDIDVENTKIPEVTIPQGRLRGVNLITRNKRNIFGFKGIPYAKPPVGELRFKGPLPPGAWNGTLDASNDSNSCPQIGMPGGGVIGNEDCLYVNVYTPRLPTSENFTRFPVMIFAHGGAFKGGSNAEASFGPQFLLDKDVVLVVPNYRLGLLGFLSTGDEVAPGNWGLKDLVRALEWNRDNIEYFGGDANQTTIFGQSAGSASVHLLTLSNSTNGLFQRYITDSGTALVCDAQRPRAALANRTIKLGNYLGCQTSTSIDLVDCLRGFNASELVDIDSRLFNVWGNFPAVVWSPTIEPDVKGAFLTERPAELIKTGKIRDLPWLSSVTRNEGILYTAKFYAEPDMFEDFLSNVDTALPAILTYDIQVADVQVYTEALKSYYLNDLTADRDLLLSNFTQLIGDSKFAYPAYSANKQQLTYAKNPQYFCSFEYQSTFSYSYFFSGGDATIHAVSHGDELTYLFPPIHSLLGPSGSEMSQDDWKMVDKMVQFWTSFAISGKPTSIDPDESVIWHRYVSPHGEYLRIGNGSDVSLSYGHNFLGDRARFWEELTAATTWK